MSLLYLAWSYEVAQTCGGWLCWWARNGNVLRAWLDGSGAKLQSRVDASTGWVLQCNAICTTALAVSYCTHPTSFSDKRKLFVIPQLPATIVLWSSVPNHHMPQGTNHLCNQDWWWQCGP